MQKIRHNTFGASESMERSDKCAPHGKGTFSRHRHPRRRPSALKVSDKVQEIVALNKAIQNLTEKIEAAQEKTKFVLLAQQWKQETKLLSNITTKCTHIAYQKIIGMGEPVVPLIIADLEDNGPNDWFWALHVITNENPITDAISGDMKAMTEAWITWWKNRSLPNSPPMKKIASKPSAKSAIE